MSVVRDGRVKSCQSVSLGDWYKIYMCCLRSKVCYGFGDVVLRVWTFVLF